MADNIHQIHNNLVQKVLDNADAATSLLQRYLPESVSQALNWATLGRRNRSFVDEHLRDTESDFVYEVQRASGDDVLWIYILVEHQSTPDKWLRFRLLRYCCRLWEMHLDQKPEPSDLRPIIPLVFYQGRSRWTYTTEFADLFAEWVRDWPGVPRFAHELVDQSGMQPEEIEGEIKVRLMQLVMLAASHPNRPWMEIVGELINTLESLPPSGGINYVRVFILYILETQEREAIESFREVLRRHMPETGGDVMTYAQELLAEGEEKGKAKGRIEERVAMIEGLLRAGAEWSMIEAASGVNEAQFQALKQQVEDMAE